MVNKALPVLDQYNLWHLAKVWVCRPSWVRYPVLITGAYAWLQISERAGDIYWANLMLPGTTQKEMWNAVEERTKRRVAAAAAEE